MAQNTDATDGGEQAESNDPTNFDGEPTLRYEVEGDEYLARAIDEDGGYVHQFADGSGELFEASLPRDATILATKNGENQVIPDGGDDRRSPL